MASRSKKPQPKMTPAQALKTAKRLALEGRIAFAETVKTEPLLPWIDRIISAMGLKWAMTTDRSHIGDCLPRGLITPKDAIDDDNREEVVQEECELLTRTLGVPVARHDTFVAVAERLRQRETH